MLTLFACPKPFVDPHIALIQRNAMRSWTKLDPNVQVLLFGDEIGVAEMAAELGCEFVPFVRRNEFGTPLLNDVFAQAEARARHDVLCYVNADIILMSDFGDTIRVARAAKERFLLGGRPWNLDVSSSIQFSTGWEECLQEESRRAADLRGYGACDYFAFNKGLWSSLPPFAVGRRGFDNALLYSARRAGAALIDATPCVVAVHQNHAYPAAVGGANAGRNPEALRNIALAGGFDCLYDWRNATHLVANGRIHRSWRGTLNVRSIRSPLYDPVRLWQVRIWFPFLHVTRPLRHRLGLRRSIVRD